MGKRGEARFWSRESISSQILQALSPSGLQWAPSLLPVPRSPAVRSMGRVALKEPRLRPEPSDGPGGCGPLSWHSCCSLLQHSFRTWIKEKETRTESCSFLTGVVVHAVTHLHVVFLRGSVLFCSIPRPSCRKHLPAEQRCPRSWQGGNRGVGSPAPCALAVQSGCWRFKGSVWTLSPILGASRACRR